MLSARDIWFDSIMAQAPGATTEVIELELTNALRTFCTKSFGWQEELGPWTAVAGTALDFNDSGTATGGVYPATYDAKIVQIMELEVDGVWGTSVNHRTAVPSTSDTVSGYYMTQPSTVVFQPAFATDKTDLVNIRAALAPENCTAKVPEYFRSHYFDAVLYGTLSKLLQHPKKPYTDVGMAIRYGAMFSTGIGTAKYMAKNKFGTSDPEWSFPIGGWNSSFAGRGS
jgi:hypothetical protein